MIMTKEDIEKKIEEIKLAISKKDYEIEYTYAVSVEAKPNTYGCYDMVIFTLDNGKVIDIRESDKQYDSTNDEIKKLF